MGAPDEDSGDIGPKTMNGNSLNPNIAVVCGSLKLWYRLTLSPPPTRSWRTLSSFPHNSPYPRYSIILLNNQNSFP